LFTKVLVFLPKWSSQNKVGRQRECLDKNTPLSLYSVYHWSFFPSIVDYFLAALSIFNTYGLCMLNFVLCYKVQYSTLHQVELQFCH